MRDVRKAEYGARDEERATLLAVALSFAVPLWIEEVRGMTDEQRAARAHECSRIVSLGEKCDETRGQHGSGPALMACGEAARGANKGGPAAVFNATALGLAIMAFQPGGVTYLGQHWEAA